MKRTKVSPALEKKLRVVRTTVADLSRVKGGYEAKVAPSSGCRPCGYTRGGY
jgi:hypothetical protein